MADSDSSEDNVPNSSLTRLAQRLLWVDTRAGLSRLIVVLAVVCVVLFLLDFVVHRHAVVGYDSLYGFHAIAGFMAFSAIVLLSRALRFVIRRDEAYYAPKAVDAERWPEQHLDRQNYQSDQAMSSDTASPAPKEQGER